MSRSLRGLAIVLTVLFGTALTGCTTLESYGRQFQDGDLTVPGVEVAPALARRQHDAASSRQLLLGDAARVQQLARCEVLRGQLAIASRSATQQMWLVWGCPFVWPVDVLTLLIWPIDETGRARAIWAAAELLERAYQTDTTTFMSTCEAVVATDVGRAFVSVQRAYGPPPPVGTGAMAD